MTKDYQQLWKGAACATDEFQAVRTLAEILADKEGKEFIPRLDSKDAELCVEILGNVSHGSAFTLFYISHPLVRASRSTISNPPRSRSSSSC